MAVGFKVKFFWYQIGSGDFLHCFFSTVAVNLEKNKWGSKFPVIMNELYQGKVEANHIDEAINELEMIKKMFANYSPDKVVWDIEDFFDIFLSALRKGKEQNLPVEIESI